MYIIFDTETTGLPLDFNTPIINIINLPLPRLVKLSWVLLDEKLQLIELKDYIIKPEGYEIPFNSTKIHGISTKYAIEKGIKINFVLEEFNLIIKKSNFLIGHNVFFDIKIVCAEFIRIHKKISFFKKKLLILKKYLLIIVLLKWVKN